MHLYIGRAERDDRQLQQYTLFVGTAELWVPTHPTIYLSFPSLLPPTHDTRTMVLRSSLTGYFVYTRFFLKKSMVLGGGSGNDAGDGYELDEWTTEAKGKRPRSGEGRGAMVKGRLRD